MKNIDTAARFLINRLEKQNRLQNNLLVETQLVFVESVSVEDCANGRFQIHSPDVAAVFVCAALVKKIPQIIYRQNVAGVGTFRRDKILECLYIRVAVLYEIKNTPLIGGEVRRKIFQQNHGHRVNRQNIGQNFFFANLDEIHNDLSRFGSAFPQGFGDIFPTVFREVFDLQRVPDKFKGDIVGHGDIHVVKSVADDSESLIAFAGETVRFVRGDEEVKRLDVGKLRQTLKLVQIVAIVAEEFGELVPK